MATAAVAAPVNSGIGYYSTSAGLPPRAVESLRGHARPIGDVGDWPLDDGRVLQLAATAKIRKRITDAANLFQAMFALTLISAVFTAIATLTATFSRRGSAGPEMVGLLVTTVITVGVNVLCFLAARATRRSQRWAPITMMVIFLLWAGLVVVGVAMAAAGSQRDAAAAVIGLIFVLLIAGAFAYSAGRAMVAIPQFRRQPAWCQEALVRVEKRK